MKKLQTCTPMKPLNTAQDSIESRDSFLQTITCEYFELFVTILTFLKKPTLINKTPHGLLLG